MDRRCGRCFAGVSERAFVTFGEGVLDDAPASVHTPRSRVMNATKVAVMALLLGACSGDRPPKAGTANAPTSQPSSEGSAMPAPKNSPATTMEQVQRWAPKGASVVDVRARGDADLEIGAGVDVFMVTPPNQGAPVADGRGRFSVVAIAGGVGNPILEDKAAILAAVAKTTNDAQKLARVGLLLDGRDDTPLQGASNEVQRKAGVAAPAIVGDAIQFWIFSGSPGRNLYRCSLDLATGVLTVEAK
jgi:hypothetical protein